MQNRWIVKVFVVAVATLVTVSAFGQTPAAADKSTDMVLLAKDLSTPTIGLPLAPELAAHSGDLAEMRKDVFAAPIIAIAPVTSAPRPKTEDAFAKNKKIWYALTIANHSAVAFDAYSTRYAVDRGARELNPTLKPFASSNWLYPVTQVSSAAFDYVGRRMMRSNHTVIRKMWWLPQSANAACSLVAGAHNLSSR